ncbi:MAG: hypothetical protein KGL39_27055 [Patescibacteria group bacterium]|nr:hypothetical protein [Patescibacteria group bacterium]
MAKLELNGTQLQKNNRGTLGPICDYCGGYGFTNMLNDMGGRSAGCPKCFGTGIEPVDTRQLKSDVDQLMKTVNFMATELQGLKNIIISEAKRMV